MLIVYGLTTWFVCFFLFAILKWRCEFGVSETLQAAGQSRPHPFIGPRAAPGRPAAAPSSRAAAPLVPPPQAQPR